MFPCVLCWYDYAYIMLTTGRKEPIKNKLAKPRGCVLNRVVSGHMEGVLKIANCQLGLLVHPLFCASLAPAILSLQWRKFFYRGKYLLAYRLPWKPPPSTSVIQDPDALLLNSVNLFLFEENTWKKLRIPQESVHIHISCSFLAHDNYYDMDLSVKKKSVTTKQWD